MIKKFFITSAWAIVFSVASSHYASAIDVCQLYQNSSNYAYHIGGDLGDLVVKLIYGCS